MDGGDTVLTRTAAAANCPLIYPNAVGAAPAPAFGISDVTGAHARQLERGASRFDRADSRHSATVSVRTAAAGKQLPASCQPAANARTAFEPYRARQQALHVLAESKMEGVEERRGRSDLLPPKGTTPRRGIPTGGGGGNKGLAMTYFRTAAGRHYHRRCVVSLPSSGWDRVVPTRCGRQADR